MIVLADFKGLKVKQVTALRQELNKAQVECLVVKKTLMVGGGGIVQRPLHQDVALAKLWWASFRTTTKPANPVLGSTCLDSGAFGISGLVAELDPATRAVDLSARGFLPLLAGAHYDPQTRTMNLQLFNLHMSVVKMSRWRQF